MINIIPPDLYSFLKEEQRLIYDDSLAELGKIELYSLNQLRIGRVYAAPHFQRDPNFEKQGVYRIPAVSLVKACEGYYPDYVLSYLPFEGRFASFDGDHAMVTLFDGAKWQDIVNSPLPYLNAIWEPEPSIKCTRIENPWWERYVFFDNAFE